jgi:PhnB protein
MKTTPYLFFGGKCEDAIAFYREALGADVRAFVRFGDLPGATAEMHDRVMHAELGIGDSTVFASDAQSNGAQGASFAISLEAPDDAEAERLFATLADHGTVAVPLMTTPFASRFGMATDRFGTPWMITTPQPPAA